METPFWGNLNTGLKRNSNALIGLGSGLLSGNTFAEGLAAAGQGWRGGADQDFQQFEYQQQKDQELDTLNKTTEWLRQNGHSNLLAAVESGAMTPGDAFQMALQPAEQNRGVVINGRLVNPVTGALMADYSEGDTSSLPSNVQEWQYYSGLSPEQQTQYLTMKRSNSPLNVGTGFVTQDPANPGNVIGGPIAIDNRGAAYQTGYGGVEGKADAESAALSESIQSKMPGLRTVIDDLTALADTATYTQGGQVMDSLKRELGLPVGQGAIDRSSYIAIVDNQVLPLLRDTFGAAFTQKEGEALRATLGDPNKSPAEKKAILNAFIAQKERDVAGMQSRAGSGPATGGWTVLGVE